MNKLGSNLFLSTTHSLNNEEESKNIYVGIGVCGRSALSQAIPFDIFSLILCAEHYRRALKAKKVFYIIADTHALLTGHDAKKVLPYALTLSHFMAGVFKEWNIPHSDLIASFISDIDYSSALKAGSNKKYMRAEIEDMYYFIEKYNVGYKLGWKYNTPYKKHGFDEWYFDKQARKLNVPLNYCYIKSGCTMSDAMSVVSPYLCLDVKNRILLKDLHLIEKLTVMKNYNLNAVQYYRKYLMEIQLLYCSLFSKPIKGLYPFILSLSKQFS